MINRALVRVLMTSAALAAGSLLAGCNSDGVSLANNAKANQPVPSKLVAAMGEKNMDPQSPILIRLFKQEAELEVWKQDRNGQFGLLKTYPICRWSGDLGPKVREGDRQAPEGFYSISPSQMNPQSAYYLSFNTGYPNAYDKSLGHTGSELMVHGDCSSRGCYAMSDEQIAEIYALGRDSFFGGQRAFQFQAYPFHMTAANMARHRNNPNMPFWKMIKEGNDHFEVSRQEPKVDFCEHKYVFDAQKPPGATRDPVFDASAKCPAYVVADSLASAVREKQAADDSEFNKLVAKGTPVARLNTGIDGGMNQVFASHVPGGASTGLSDTVEPHGLTLMSSMAPGTIPAYVNPPATPGPDEAASSRVAAVTAPEKSHLMANLRKAGTTGALAANT
ncbi:MAG: murein L,D-transpeptidase family protein, partial [Bradyrhizobium sp.]|uniref:L,D-transpeptidase family protein n=1 Tax=Bradyrhizobium sp. TaxID=376 RepID=UPI003C7CCD99